MTHGNVFVLDVEATSRTPMSGLMTEFGVVHLGSGVTFYAHIYDFTPSEENVAVPVVVRTNSGDPVENPYIRTGMYNSLCRELPMENLRTLAEFTKEWVLTLSEGRPTLVSDNPGFDAMWFNCFLDEHGVSPVFGHSSRRIGDFYSGQRGKWNDQSSWKKLRKTRHTHNPADDAYGNAEALREILGVEPYPTD